MLKKLIFITTLLSFSYSTFGGDFSILTAPYKPNMKTNIIKNATTGEKYTYDDIYGKSGTYLTFLHYDYQIIKKHGSLYIGGEAGFAMDRGHSLIQNDLGEYVPSGERLYLYSIPINILAGYELNYLRKQPLVPFVEGGGTYWIFQEKKENRGSTTGAKKGYFYGGGIKFLLDLLEPTAAAEMKIDYGIFHTYLIGGYRNFTIKYPQKGFNFSGNLFFAALSFNF